MADLLTLLGSVINPASMAIIAALITVFLWIAFSVHDFPNTQKPIIALFVGVGAAMVVLVIDGGPWTAKVIAIYIVAGVVMGAAAIGFNEGVRAKLNPRPDT